MILSNLYRFWEYIVSKQYTEAKHPLEFKKRLLWFGRVSFHSTNIFIYSRVRNTCSPTFFKFLDFFRGWHLLILKKGIRNLKYLKPSNGGILQFLRWTFEIWSRDQFFHMDQLNNRAGVKSGLKQGGKSSKIVFFEWFFQVKKF